MIGILAFRIFSVALELVGMFSASNFIFDDENEVLLVVQAKDVDVPVFPQDQSRRQIRQRNFHQIYRSLVSGNGFNGAEYQFAQNVVA